MKRTSPLVRRSIPLALFLGLMLTTACALPVDQIGPLPTATPPGGAEPIRLGRGVNLGNALEAPREGDWGVVLQEEYFQLIKDAGFDSVRIPIRWSAHAKLQPPYTIDPNFFDRVDWAVEQALSRGLVVVINIHHYDELVADPAAQEERFLAIWRQIAEHYADYPPQLLFELLNEPHDALDMPTWYALYTKALAIVRESNPTRDVIIGGGNWNSIGGLYGLILPPDDPHIIATFHYYSPFEFTHQGAEWVSGASRWLGTPWNGTEADKAAIEKDLDEAVAWAKENGRRLFMGEFGAYSKADMDSRVRWTSFVARSAEARGIEWAYWEFCAGFGIYDRVTHTWNEPLLRALIPER